MHNSQCIMHNELFTSLFPEYSLYFHTRYSIFCTTLIASKFQRTQDLFHFEFRRLIKVEREIGCKITTKIRTDQISSNFFQTFLCNRLISSVTKKQVFQVIFRRKEQKNQNLERDSAFYTPCYTPCIHPCRRKRETRLFLKSGCKITAFSRTDQIQRTIFCSFFVTH